MNQKYLFYILFAFLFIFLLLTFFIDIFANTLKDIDGRILSFVAIILAYIAIVQTKSYRDYDREPRIALSEPNKLNEQEVHFRFKIEKMNEKTFHFQKLLVLSDTIINFELHKIIIYSKKNFFYRTKKVYICHKTAVQEVDNVFDKNSIIKFSFELPAKAYYKKKFIFKLCNFEKDEYIKEISYNCYDKKLSEKTVRR